MNRKTDKIFDDLCRGRYLNVHEENDAGNESEVLYLRAEEVGKIINKLGDEIKLLKKKNSALKLILKHFPKDVLNDQMGEDYDKLEKLLSSKKHG